VVLGHAASPGRDRQLGVAAGIASAGVIRREMERADTTTIEKSFISRDKIQNTHEAYRVRT
jgi:hypothetical protein